MMDLESIREWFPITRQYNFLNHAAVAPLCKPAAEAMREYITHLTEQGTLQSDFYRQADQARKAAAQLLNATPEEITFVKNTTEGLGWVAGGLNWSTGDNVVTTNVEFPANIYPWMALQSRGVQLRMVPEENGRVPTERLVSAIDNRTRVLTVSSVQFASGFRSDLAALGQVCKQKGVLFCVDAIQSLGAFPIDVRAMNIDFLSADGHKWLCAPEGCGVFYCNRSLVGHLRPIIAGWLGMEDAFDFGSYKFQFVDTARKFDIGSYNLVGICGLGAAMRMFLEIGIEQVASRILMLTDRLVAGLRDKGYRVISSRAAGEASGIVSFVSDRHDPVAIRQHLENEYRIIIAVREGRLRCSPHVYNTPAEIDQLIERLPKH